MGEQGRLPMFADRCAALKNEGAYKVLAEAQALEATGRDIVHLEIGQPDLPTPPPIVQAGIEALQSGQTKYTAPRGTVQIRSKVAEYTNRTRALTDLPVHPDQVVIGPGCKPGIFMTILALVNKGDEVIIPDPGFPAYVNAIGVSEGVTVRVPLTSDGDGFELEALKSAVSNKTKLIVVNSPSNPSGGTMCMAHLEEIAGIALAADCWVLSDEIYSRLIYSGESCAPSMLSIPAIRPKLIVADGFSKTFCMTGWRLGWAIMPEELAAKVELLVVHCFGCTASFSQIAGVAALAPEMDSHVAAMVTEYKGRRDAVVDLLNNIPGVRCPTPTGAFYAFFDVSSFGLPSADVASKILKEGGCDVLPGSDFGPASEGYLRISYVSSMDVIREGIKRIATVLSCLENLQEPNA